MRVLCGTQAQKNLAGHQRPKKENEIKDYLFPSKIFHEVVDRKAEGNKEGGRLKNRAQAVHIICVFDTAHCPRQFEESLHFDEHDYLKIGLKGIERIIIYKNNMHETLALKMPTSAKAGAENSHPIIK